MSDDGTKLLAYTLKEAMEVFAHRSDTEAARTIITAKELEVAQLALAHREGAFQLLRMDHALLLDQRDTARKERDEARAVRDAAERECSEARASRLQAFETVTRLVGEVREAQKERDEVLAVLRKETRRNDALQQLQSSFTAERDEWRAKAEARDEAQDVLQADVKAGLRVANALTLETQTVEGMATDLVRLVREARLQRDAAATQYDVMRKDYEPLARRTVQLREALTDAEDKLRSALSIASDYVTAERTAAETNWRPWRDRVRESLEKIHAALKETA